ncbi:putative chlorophyll A-B binding protein [Helianthus annuus]|nr:putative chlorophyll A-B binding protein [Helianthus annuus]
MICSSSSLSTANGGLLLQQSSFSNNRHSATAIRWGVKRGIGSGNNRTKSQVANANVCITKAPSLIYISRLNMLVTIASGKGKKEVIMVDPAEAKRLAAKQMENIKRKQTFKRRRQIEAINGAWAMLGLTAGLVIEGQTGNGILAQLAGYWAAVVNIFVR